MATTIPSERQARFDQLPWWAQLVVLYPSLWKFWLPAGPTIWGLVWFFTALATGISSFYFLTVLGVAITTVYLVFALETIEEDAEGKPQFGLLEVLGLRLPITFDEGLQIKIPFLSRIVRRSKELFNDDIEIESVKCRLKPMETSSASKSGGSRADDQDAEVTFYRTVAHALSTPSPSDIQSGGSVKVALGLTFERDWTDGWAVLDYDNAGETEGFLDISRDAIEEDLREIGRRLSWLQFMFATDLISAHLITRLTGESRFETREIFENPDPDFITKFLDDVRINGRSYIRGLGVRIRRVQAKSVDPIGRLAEASEVAALEEMKRLGLLANVQALADAVKKLGTELDDGSMTHKDLVNTIQVDEDGSRVEKKIIEVSANDVEKLGEAVKGLFAKAV